MITKKNTKQKMRFVPKITIETGTSEYVEPMLITSGL